MASVIYHTDIWEDERHNLSVFLRDRAWEDKPMYVARYNIPWDCEDDYDNDYSLTAYTLNDLKDLLLDKELELSIDTELWLRARDNEIS